MYSYPPLEFHLDLELARLKNQLAKELLMKKNSAKPSTFKKVVLEPVIRMESYPFTAQIRLIVKTSVLGQLGIANQILHDMGEKDLRVLSVLLAEATSKVTQEGIRRSGLKT